MAPESRTTDDRTRYYAIGKNGEIIGGGSDNRAQADEWLESDGVVDIIASKDRIEARRKYID